MPRVHARLRLASYSQQEEKYLVRLKASFATGQSHTLDSMIVLLLRPSHFIRLLLALLTTTSILVPVDASFMERAQNWFSPFAMIQRLTLTNPSNQLGAVGFLRKSSNHFDDKVKNTSKSHDIGRRALLDIGYNGALYNSATSYVSLAFDNAPLWKSISTVCISNTVGCVLSLATGSHLHLDLLGAGAFGMAALSALINSPKRAIPRVILSSSLVILWSFKLALFLFVRILKNKHDARLDELLSTTSGAGKKVIRRSSRCMKEIWTICNFLLGSLQSAHLTFPFF